MRPWAGKTPPPFIFSGSLHVLVGFIFYSQTHGSFSNVVSCFFGGRKIRILNKHDVFIFLFPVVQMCDRRASLVVQSVAHGTMTLSDGGFGTCLFKAQLNWNVDCWVNRLCMWTLELVCYLFNSSVVSSKPRQAERLFFFFSFFFLNLLVFIP